VSSDPQQYRSLPRMRSFKIGIARRSVFKSDNLSANGGGVTYLYMSNFQSEPINNRCE